MPGETDLDTLLRGLDPELDPEEYVFALAPVGCTAAAIARLREAEGETLIIPRSDAERLALSWTYPCRRITLRIHSSLEAVGFLARVAAALAAEGISVNPVSAYYHDHLFVPVSRARDALRILRNLK